MSVGLICLFALGGLVVVELVVGHLFPRRLLVLALLPWGRGRDLPVHPERLNSLRGPEHATDYRKSARAPVDARGLKLLGGTRMHEVTALEPLPGRSAALLISRPKRHNIVEFRILILAALDGQAGVARVKPKLVVPVGQLAFVVTLVALLTGGYAVVTLWGALMVLIGVVGTIVGLLRLDREMTWAYGEIERHLSRAPKRRAPSARASA